MRNFYVLTNDGEEDKMLYFPTELKAREVAYNFLDREDLKYIEYGIMNYDGWANSCLVVLKNEVE